jgi:hypothetical protein
MDGREAMEEARQPDLVRVGRAQLRREQPSVRMPRHARLYQQNEVHHRVDPALLEELTGYVPELFGLARCLELRFDFVRGDLFDLPALLPHLRELNISDSNLSSLRSLGSGLMRLQVLWVARNSLTNLDAINCFS